MAVPRRLWIGLAALGATFSTHAAAAAAGAAGTERTLQDGTQLLQASADVRRIDPAPVSNESIESIHRPNMGPTNKVLLFFAVGSKSFARTLVRKNVDHARTFRDLTFDLYLAHYDNNRSAWYKELGDWYPQNVRYSAQVRGLKFWLARDLLLVKQRYEKPELYGPQPYQASVMSRLPAVDVDSYEFLWILDEDAAFYTSDLERMVQLARDSGASIMTPAFQTIENPESGLIDAKHSRSIVHCQAGDSDCEIQYPSPSCDYRLVNYVEVSFTLMKTQAFKNVLGRCFNCLPVRGSTWGLSRVWCNWDAEAEHKPPEKTCAIIDGAPITHANAKTHTKYGKSGANNANSRAAHLTNKTLGKYKTLAHQVFSCEKGTEGRFR